MVASEIPHRPVVCNTSPLINLAGVGLLALLPTLYGTILIPGAVHREYVAGMRSGDPALDDLEWVEIAPPVPVQPELPAGLGAGEAEAIALAIAANARAILLDEHLARNVATKNGLPVVGTLAVLIAAKQTGLLVAVKPIIDTMMSQGRHISESLYEHILASAGEAS